MSAASPQKIIILAGPNGAGKTTFAREFLPQEADCPEFINADLIAQGLSPFTPERVTVEAGEIMLQLIEKKVTLHESFAIETTLAARSYIRRIPAWRKTGYHVKLIFLSLPSPELAISRVKIRVRQGGHDIPEDVIRRRFELGLANLETYKKLVDSWITYDNTGDQPRILATGENR